MYRLLVTGQRSYIVGKDDVLKGGKARKFPAGPEIREEVELFPSKTVYEVTDSCGKELDGRTDINVIEIVKEKKGKK